MIRELVLGALTPNQTRYGGEPSRRILPEAILCNLLQNGSDYDRRYAERVNNMCSTIAVGILETATLETLGMVCSFEPFQGARLLVRIVCHKFVKVDDIKWTDFQSKLILFCLVRTHFLRTDDEAGITECLIQEFSTLAISNFSYRHQKVSWLSFKLSPSFILETSCLHVFCKFMDCFYAVQYHTAATFHLRIYVSRPTWAAAFLAIICADLWLIVVECPWSILPFGKVL